MSASNTAGYDVRHGRIHPDWPRCSLCHKQVRSLYSLPGDKSARMCAPCFFRASVTFRPAQEPQ